MNQHQPLLHAISLTLKRLWISHQIESGEPFTADRNLRMDIAVKRSGLRVAPNREYREKSILLVDVSHADPQAQVHTREEAVLTTMDQLPLPPRCASANTTLVRDTCPSTNGVTNLPPFAVEIFWRLGVGGSIFIDQLAASVVGGRDGESPVWKGVVKGNVCSESSR